MSVSCPDVGMVIPTWYPADAEEALVEHLLELTLGGMESTCRPNLVVLVLDGQPRWEGNVRRAAERRGLRHLCLPTNIGKGGAVAAGIAELAEERPVLVATRDSDGDHRMEDLPALAELARQMGEETGNQLLLVSGGRPDRVRPLGFERAQYELITDRVLWQALQFHAARRGTQLTSVYFAAHGDIPDIQSGYKVYSLAAAHLAAQVLDPGRDGAGIGRWGVETAPAVEILSADGVLGVGLRRTYQEQPVSGFRGVDALRLYAEPLAWALRRLEVPADAAAAMLDGALMRSPLVFDFRRRDEVLAVREAVLTTLGGTEPLLWGARFV